MVIGKLRAEHGHGEGGLPMTTKKGGVPSKRWFDSLGAVVQTRITRSGFVRRLFFGRGRTE